MRERLRKEAAVVAAIAVASLVVRVVFALGMDSFQDEALYWWQAGEGVSFSVHPPTTALLVRLGLAVFGHGVAALRAGSLLAGTVGIVLAYLLGRQMYGGRSGVWAAALFASCPLFAAMGAVATPDASLLALWLLFMYTAWRAAQTRSTAWWLAAGVVLAAGLYTKYMMVLAVPSLLLALLASKEGRALLKTPGPWLGLFVGFALFVPVFLIWDWRAGWPTLRYHLVARHHFEFEWEQVGTYVLEHVGAISPLLFVGVLWALGRWCLLWRRGDPRGAWLASFGLVPVFFFLAPSLFTERALMRVQWDSIGYASGVVGFALLLRERGVRARVLRRRRRLATAGMMVALATLAVALVIGLWPGLAARAGKRPPMGRMLGWRDLADHVRQIQQEWKGPPRFIVTDSFRPALCLGFQLDVREGIYTLAHRRNRRYGVVPELQRWGINERHMLRDRQGQGALYIHEYRVSSRSGEGDPPKRIYRFFSQVEEAGDFYVVRAGYPVKHFGIFNCEGLVAERPKPEAR